MSKALEAARALIKLNHKDLMSIVQVAGQMQGLAQDERRTRRLEEQVDVRQRAQCPDYDPKTEDDGMGSFINAGIITTSEEALAALLQKDSGAAAPEPAAEPQPGAPAAKPKGFMAKHGPKLAMAAGLASAGVGGAVVGSLMDTDTQSVEAFDVEGSAWEPPGAGE